MNDLNVNSWRESRRKNTSSIQRMQRNARVAGTTWHGIGFLIEAMVLLAFVALAIAVFFRLFAFAKERSSANTELSQAVVYASNAAEQFAAAPETMSGYAKARDNYYITCSVTSEDTAVGTMYNAIINVSSQDTGELLYSLATSKYEGNVAGRLVISDDTLVAVDSTSSEDTATTGETTATEAATAENSDATEADEAEVTNDATAEDDSDSSEAAEEEIIEDDTMGSEVE